MTATRELHAIGLCTISTTPSWPSAPPPGACGPSSASPARRRSRSARRSSSRRLKSQISNLKFKHRTILSGSVRINDDLSVDALLYPFLAPHSYTGQDLIELHVQAGACLVEALLERLLADGCRAAGPGRIHRPRLPQRQARSGPGRGGQRGRQQLQRPPIGGGREAPGRPAHEGDRARSARPCWTS